MGQRRHRGGTEEAQRRDRGGTEEGQRRAFSERDVLVAIDVVVVVIAVAVPRLGSAECAERLNNNENNCSYTTHKQSNRQGKYRCAQNLFLHNLFTTGTPGMPIRDAAIDGYRSGALSFVRPPFVSHTGFRTSTYDLCSKRPRAAF